MSTQVHESAKWLSTAGASMTAWATMSGQDALSYVGVVVAVASALGSWYVAQRSQIRKAEREQSALDAVNAREQRWLDAIMEWQIQQIRSGKVQLPRNRRDDVPAMPNPLLVPDPPVPPFVEPEN